MPRFPLRSLGLALLLLLPAPPLALLCRGRTPTRFEARNLPAWERHTAGKPVLPHVSAHAAKRRLKTRSVT